MFFFLKEVGMERKYFNKEVTIPNNYYYDIIIMSDIVSDVATFKIILKFRKLNIICLIKLFILNT